MKKLSCLAVVLIGLSTLNPLPGQPQNQPPVEYGKSDLLTEQRIMNADIKDANYYIDRGIKAVGANLPESAKVCVLRATGLIAKIKEMMKGHPERIERLSLVLFQSREKVRAELRKSYAAVRDNFSAVEDAMYALRRDMLRKGLFGEELKQQVAVLDAASKLAAEIRDKDPALADKIRAKIEAINLALANNDAAAAKQGIDELNALLSSSGYGDRVKQQQQKLEDMAAAGAGAGGAAATPGGAAAAAAAVAGGPQIQTLPDGSTVTTSTNSITLPDGRKQDIVEKVMKRPDGSSQVVRTTTVANPDGSKDVTEVVEERDRNGNLLSTKTSQYKIMPDGSRMEKGSVKDDGERVTITDASGATTTVPKSFFHGNEATAYQTIYVGGEGQKLTAERELKITLKRDDAGSIAGFDQHTGREREWDFVIAEAPDSRKFDTNGMSTRLVFRDNKRKTDFKIESWSIKDPQGREVGRFGAQNEVDFKFPTSGQYTLGVSGATDWGNQFTVSVTLNVAL